MRIASSKSSSFHPLKAGRRPERTVKALQHDIEFPSPQGGSETPKASSPAVMEARFHPLKAGRRLFPSMIDTKFKVCFHPLKAGRRLYLNRLRRHSILVSIPSRRVGDQSRRTPFPAPALVSIPSRRVGDSAVNKVPKSHKVVSIPSRRVGDLDEQLNRAMWFKFPSPQGGSETGG